MIHVIAEERFVQFTVEPAFWSLFPQARIGVVVARGIDNARAGDTCAALLAAAMRDAAARIGEAEMATHPAIAPWREAYRAFGVKPAKFRSSIENLLRSAVAGRVGSINPLVDLYNTVSLTHFLPCGGEDLRAIAGPIRLTRAAGGEDFVPLGSAEPQPPQPGEVIYRDDVGVICRSWNWREAERTKLTAATTDAFLCIEAVPPIGAETLVAACDELAALVTAHLGGTAAITIVTADAPEMRVMD
jgi:DNA/RNA-binding domain of Phe-tRNA-synthetase-like protein